MQETRREVIGMTGSRIRNQNVRDTILLTSVLLSWLTWWRIVVIAPRVNYLSYLRDLTCTHAIDCSRKILSSMAHLL